MKFKELKKKTPAELNKILGESREKLRDLRFKVATKQIKNIREIREIKRLIAKVLMLLSRKVDSESVVIKKQEKAGREKSHK